jgi:hypothetical protein
VPPPFESAVHIGRLAIGQVEPEDDGKDPNAKALAVISEPVVQRLRLGASK